MPRRPVAGRRGQRHGGAAMTKLHDPDEVEQARRLAAGWRRFIETLERVRRQRRGEPEVRLHTNCSSS